MAQLVAAGRALLSPFVSAGSWYNRTAQASPLATGVVTTGVKTSAADAFAQLAVERREKFDWTRHAVFCTFGFAYLGAFQYWLYNVKFSQWCGPITQTFGHRGSAPVKVLIDQGLHHPLIYFPTFFSMKVRPRAARARGVASFHFTAASMSRPPPRRPLPEPPRGRAGGGGGGGGVRRERAGSCARLHP
jgi:protein Mpv17